MSVPVLSTPSSLAMARSPQFITGKNNALTNDQLQAMSLTLRIGSGAVPSGTANYTLSKDYSINQVINFEVSDLVRSEFYHDFTVWNDIGYVQSPQGEVLWVVPTGDWRYSNNGSAPRNRSMGNRRHLQISDHRRMGNDDKHQPYGSQSVGACYKS